MKLTIIGAGNMGGALALGLTSSEAVNGADITVTARHTSSLEKFKSSGIITSTDNVSAVIGSDIVFYAVKPWQMEAVLNETKGALDYSSQLIVSIAPGVPAESLKSWLAKEGGEVPSIAYVIPNTAIEIGESMTFISPVTASEAQTKMLKELFDRVGKSEIVDLEHMLAGTSLASCGIAYAMRYIGAATEGGAILGLDGIDIKDAVCQTVKGAAELVSSRGLSAQEEIDKVTTPNGLTIKGLNAMEQAGFSSSVIKGLTVIGKKKKRIVVKVGSNTLTRADGSLDITRVSAIVDQIVKLRQNGFEVVLVSSGAVACGRSLLNENDSLDEVQQRQLYSAIGQVRLMDLYYRLFIDYDIVVGQILTMKKNFSTEEEYNNQLNCMEVMLHSNVIPIVNENDTVSITELMFTDNDELSGLVAEMVGAETLILLTNVDGIYDGDPDDPSSKVIRKISMDESNEDFICESKSKSGRGGMMSKFRTAKAAAEKGIRVIIANGRRDGIINDVLERPDETIHTEIL